MSALHNRRHTDWQPAWRRAIQRDVDSATIWIARNRGAFRCGVVFVAAVILAIATATPETAGPAFPIKQMVSSAARA